MSLTAGTLNPRSSIWPFLGLLLLLSAQAARAETQLLPTGELRRFADIYGLIHTDYVKEVDEAKLFNGCFNGMLKSLDARSVYLDADAFNDLRGFDRKNEGRSGMEIQFKAGLPYVIAVFDDSSASRAGIKVKDYILAINGESTDDMELDTTIKKLRGAPGTNVLVTVRRYGEIEERKFSLTLEPFKKPAIKANIVSPGIGYVRINGFDLSTPDSLSSAFADLKVKNNGDLKGLILDLRDSPGGQLMPTAEVAAMFLQNDALIYETKGRLDMANNSVRANHANFKTSITKNWPPELASVPLVVLVNENTASGAEIVAAALQENKRSVLVGRKTFGLGSIQSIRQLSPEAAVKMTIAYFTTPSGKTIQGSGLVPDYTIPVQDAPAKQEQADAWISTATELLKTRP